MKTKISHISKSTLSVILAIMMIISTMAVGMISANAVNEAFTPNSTLYINIGSTWEENYTNKVSVPYINFRYAENDNTYIDRIMLTEKVAGTTSTYSVTVPNKNYVRAFTLERADYNAHNTVWDSVTTTSQSRSDNANNLFTISSWHENMGWSTYTPPQNPAVASSVSLTANPTSVEKDNDITLTAALTGKASGLGNVTYTFSKTSSGAGSFTGNGSTVTSSSTTASTTFTPSGTGKYTFKVVASATNYNSVESTVEVDVTAPAVYYVQGRFRVKASADATSYTYTFDSGNWAESSKKIKFEPVEGDTDLYKLETYCTLSELSQDITGTDGYTGEPFLYITRGDESSAGNTKYFASSATTFTLTNKSVTLVTNGGANNNLKFDTNSTKGPVTLYFKPSTSTLYYELPLESYNVTVKSQTTNDGSAWANQDGANSHATFPENATTATDVDSSGITVTAENVEGYQFVGWVTKDANSGTFTNANDASTTFKPSKNNAVAIAQYKKIYTISATANGDGTVNPASQTKLAGENFSVVVTPNSGKEIKSVTVNGTAQTISNDQKLNGYTYSAAASSDVVLVAEFKERSKYTVTAVSSDTELGTVTPASTDVLAGNTAAFTYTLVAPDAQFVRWDISGGAEELNTNGNSITVTVTGPATVTAIFTKPAPYQVVYDNGSYKMFETQTKGVYVSEEEIGDGWWVSLKNIKTNQYVLSGKSPYGLNPYEGVLATGTASTESNYSWKNNSSTSYYLVYNTNVGENGLVYLVDKKDKPIFIYAKDGTVRADSGSETYNTSDDYGDTYLYDAITKKEVTASDSKASYNFYKNYKVGDIINIRTKVDTTYKNCSYYVYAYCINGVKVDASLINSKDGIYGASYEITDRDAFLEITPVYYNKQLESKGAYITFYVKSTPEQKKSWASTISVDAYSYKSATAASGVSANAHFLGDYPGQPMVRESFESDIYIIKVPKEAYKIGTDGKTMVKDSNYGKVNGVTLNNYKLDDVHSKIFSNAINKQTFDFADFNILADREDVRTLRFDFKYYAHDSSAKEHASVAHSSDLAKKPSELTTTNKWYAFKNYYDHKTDIFGYDITNEEYESSTKHLYIISSGSYDTSKDTTVNTQGQWASYWYVYDETGEFKVKGTPADFAQTGNSVYNELNGYKGCPVDICYDKEQAYRDNDNTPIHTVRCDGRWYYSAIGREYSVNVKVQRPDESGVYKDVPYVNTDNTCYRTAENTSVNINNYREATFSDIDFDATLTMETIADGYRFDGWYEEITDEDGTTSYIPVNDEYKNMSNEVLITGPATYVARVSKIPEGTLTISHEKYSDDDPIAQGGSGIYYVSATLIKGDSSGNIVIPEKRGSIDIQGLTDEDQLEITLRTNCIGDNTFYSFYEYAARANGYFEIGPENDIRGDGEVSYTFTLKAKDLFKDNKLYVSSLRYYSDITKVGGTCTINYQYVPRFEEGYKTYTVRNIELSDEEIDNGYKPSYDTIMKNAPNIDTMYLDTKWILSDTTVSQGKSVATVYATQDNKKCDVYVCNVDGRILNDKSYPGTAFNTLLMSENGDFFVIADRTYNDMKFAYWLVIDYKKYVADNNISYDDASTFEADYADLIVTRCYDRGFGLRIMSDYMLVPVYKKDIPSVSATISAPVFNREISGDSLKPTDKLFVDFLVAYSSIDVPVFNLDTSANDYDVECGVFLVRNNTKRLSADNRDTIVNAAKSNDADPTSGIIDAYKATYNDEAIRDELTSLISSNNNTLQNIETIKDMNGNDNQFRFTYFINDNSKLTNKNRLDKIINFTNNQANQNYFFTAYSYVAIRDADGEIALDENDNPKIAISEAQHFNLCYLGNSVYAQPNQPAENN